MAFSYERGAPVCLLMLLYRSSTGKRYSRKKDNHCGWLGHMLMALLWGPWALRVLVLGVAPFDPKIDVRTHPIRGRVSCFSRLLNVNSFGSEESSYLKPTDVCVTQL